MISAQLPLRSSYKHPYPSAASPEQFATVKIGSITWLLPFKDIQLVAANENYTEVTLTDNRRLLVRRTMRQWAALLPPAQFARVHRSLFLNLDHVARVERRPGQPSRLHFTAGLPSLAVKRRHWPALRTKLELRRSLAPNNFLRDS